MPLLIARKNIPGTTESIVCGDPVRQVKRGQFWDVRGEFEIAGELGGRQIVIQHLLHKRYPTIEDCQDALDDIHELQGEHGVCRYTGTANSDRVKQNYADCTVESIATVPFGNQAILKDVSSTLLDDEGNGDGGYYCRLIITLRQLTF